MWLYLLLFLIPLLAYMSGEAENRNKSFLAGYMMLLGCFVGMADMLGGYDRYIYGELFDSIADGITRGQSYESIKALSFYEAGYSALCYLIALVTENRYIYIFIVTLIIYYCFYKAFEQNMTNYPLAVMIFLGMVFYFTFAYMRQVLAFSVAWLGVVYLVNGKKWKFFTVVLLVALLHKSGIVFAGLYFMPLKKWSKKTVLTILSVCTIVGLTGVTGAFYDAFTNTTDMESANSYSTNLGVRVAYLIEVVFFVWIILHNYDKIAVTRRNIVFLNMAWAFCALLLLFIRSSDGGRVAWFFTLGIIYTVTLVCSTPTIYGRVKNQLSYFMIALMLMLYLRIYNGWQAYNTLYPYKTFLTDGYRSPDYYWSRYEYDHRYDKDKFYRPAFRFLK